MPASGESDELTRSDEIFVLEQGRLVGSGSYAELKRNDDLFRRMTEASA